ncbi:unnamed protein product [Owenia fusiformis]|uniref:G-protein coupled receptors family 1 profile domain-containing protein n=1 Tax=Owenia fusiformis TaxID=6347 RepID=A0A8S4NS42_OWEFU|nr:unnamed protein product [Owenia fusiformis]
MDITVSWFLALTIVQVVYAFTTVSSNIAEKIPTEVLKDTIMPTDALEDTMMSTDALGDTMMSTDVLEDTMMSTDVLENTMMSTDALEDTMMSTDVLENTMMSTDALEDTMMSTDVLEDTMMSIDVLENTTMSTDVLKNVKMATGFLEDTTFTINDDNIQGLNNTSESLSNKHQLQVDNETLNGRNMSNKHSNNRSNSTTINPTGITLSTEEKRIKTFIGAFLSIVGILANITVICAIAMSYKQLNKKYLLILSIMMCNLMTTGILTPLYLVNLHHSILSSSEVFCNMFAMGYTLSTVISFGSYVLMSIYLFVDLGDFTERKHKAIIVSLVLLWILGIGGVVINGLIIGATYLPKQEICILNPVVGFIDKDHDFEELHFKQELVCVISLMIIILVSGILYIKTKFLQNRLIQLEKTSTRRIFDKFANKTVSLKFDTTMNENEIQIQVQNLEQNRRNVRIGVSHFLKNYTQTYAILFTIFVICNLPFFIFATLEPKMPEIPTYLFKLLLLLRWCSCIIHPIVYGLRFTTLRRAIIRLKLVLCQNM